MKKPNVRIGIRPVIDGRWGGIREGLEEQTMGMAVAAKELIETKLPTAPLAEAKKPPHVQKNLKIIMYALLSPLLPVGVTVPKPWIWIRLPSKQYGDLTVQSAPALCILPP